MPIGMNGCADEVGMDFSMKGIAKEHIKKVLRITNGNKKKAASMLGFDTATLWRKLKSYRIPS